MLDLVNYNIAHYWRVERASSRFELLNVIDKYAASIQG